ncbi:MAG: helix-turn-helix transcriptional regulator [Acidobacteriota bacterium]|nr:helix-turn-helix transcriptional regulator [Acidobacteriota bacterium]
MPITRLFPDGRIVRWRRVGGLALAEIEYAAGQRLVPRAGGHWRVVFVLRGGLLAPDRDGARPAPASTLIHLPPGAPCDWRAAAGGATCLAIDIDAGWMGRTGASGLRLAAAEFRGGLLGHLARRLYGEFRLRDEVSRLAIDSLMLGVVAEAIRRQDRLRAGRQPGWLHRVRELLHARFAEPLTLDEIAATAGVHRVHLARAFREWQSCTIGEYVRNLRLEFVCRELATSSAPLAELALAAGFSDQSHCTRIFKRHLGMTPGRYRRTCATR